MKKFALVLLLLPFILNYSGSSTAIAKEKANPSKSKVNFSSAFEKPGYKYILPDTTGNDTSSTVSDTIIKS